MKEKKAFTLYWLSGQRQVICGGDDIAMSMTLAGYSQGALRALDFYADGDDHEWEWNAKTREWVAKGKPTNSAA